MSDDKPLPPTDPTPEPAVQTQSGLSLRMKLLLFGSLAANLLVVGFVVGAIVLGGPGRGPDGSPRLRDAGLGPFANVLSSDERRGLRDELRNRAPAIRQVREQMREDFREILGALRAEPFDPDRLTTALQSQRNTATEMTAIGQQALIERISNASPEERQAIANRIERALRRGGRK